MTIHSSLWFFVLVALVAHLLLKGVSIPGWENDSTLFTKKRDTIEIERWDSPQKKDRQIVQTSPSDYESNEEAKYLGEHRNRVKKEAQSPLRGAFRDGPSKQAVPSMPEITKEGAEGMRVRPQPSIQDLMLPGRSPHALSGQVGIGSETMLNTDPFKYASFLNRIGEEVYDGWVRRVRDAATRLQMTGRRLQNTVYESKIQVTLLPNGDIESIQLLKSCGIPELDEAPKDAFWEVEPLRNPPAQMFEDRESIPLTYTFNFELRSSSFSSPTWDL